MTDYDKTVNVSVQVKAFYVDDMPCCFEIGMDCCVFLCENDCTISEYVVDEEGMPRPTRDCPVHYGEMI